MALVRSDPGLSDDDLVAHRALGIGRLDAERVSHRLLREERCSTTSDLSGVPPFAVAGGPLGRLVQLILLDRSFLRTYGARLEWGAVADLGVTDYYRGKGTGGCD